MNRRLCSQRLSNSLIALDPVKRSGSRTSSITSRYVLVYTSWAPSLVSCNLRWHIVFASTFSRRISQNNLFYSNEFHLVGDTTSQINLEKEWLVMVGLLVGKTRLKKRDCLWYVQRMRKDVWDHYCKERRLKSLRWDCCQYHIVMLASDDCPECRHEVEVPLRIPRVHRLDHLADNYWRRVGCSADEALSRTNHVVVCILPIVPLSAGKPRILEYSSVTLQMRIDAFSIGLTRANLSLTVTKSLQKQTNRFCCLRRLLIEYGSATLRELHVGRRLRIALIIGVDHIIFVWWRSPSDIQNAASNKIRLEILE